MITISVNKTIYELIIVADKGAYTVFPKERTNIISEGDTLDEAIQKLFDVIEVADKLEIN